MDTKREFGPLFLDTKLCVCERVAWQTQNHSGYVGGDRERAGISATTLVSAKICPGRHVVILRPLTATLTALALAIG
jgi:hypothetical protein